MRRKNRKWVAIAVALYLAVMWFAYRWSIAQRPTDGDILTHIEREGVRRLAEERAKEERAKEAGASPKQAGESRLSAAGPAFVAARYDETHVVFMVAAETESRFANSHYYAGTPSKIPAPITPAAPLAELQELWEPDSHSLHFFPEIIQQTHPGEQWTLSVSPRATIPVTIERPVIAPTGCSLAMGFLASVPLDHQAAFRSWSDYFVVRRTPVESAQPPSTASVIEFAQRKILPATARQVEKLLTARMKEEVARIDARLAANAASPGAAGESPIGGARLHFKEWIYADGGLTRGEGVLDYDVREFLITPDGAPRLFVRARWTLAGSPAFLMAAWFRADAPKTSEDQSGGVPAAEPDGPNIRLLSADSSWSTILRESEHTGSLGKSLDFQSILNEFDADHDGWAELLIESDQGDSTSIGLYLYTDLGLVPMKTPLRRDTQSPESCTEPQT